MTTLHSYLRAQDCFDAVVASVPTSEWDAPSACAGWSMRDVVGHVIWGQELLRHWATGQAYSQRAGAPGGPHPGELAGSDPVATWRATRAATIDALSDEALGRAVVLPGLGERPVAAVVTMLITDHLAHAWDIGHALGIEPQLDPHLVAESLAWARENIIRVPGFFGPELSPPEYADEQTRWLAFLGRAAWQPVPA